MKKFFMIMLLFVLAGITGCKGQNPDLKRVNEEVNAFIENYLSDYINDESQDVYVIRALAKLIDAGYEYDLVDYVNSDTIKSSYNNFEYDSVASIFKGLLIMDIYKEVPSKAVNALVEIDKVFAWDEVNAYVATKLANQNLSLQAELLSKITVIKDEDFRDADFAGMALMATSKDTVDRSVYYNFISSKIVEGGVESWGAANSCSTAMVILGLLATEKDPRTYYEGSNLIEDLLAFCKEGAASYKLDEEIDLQFSTPQVFAALALYKIYAEKNVFVNLVY